MKIKMLVAAGGVDFSLKGGDETERFSDREAVRLIEAGYAVPVSAHKIERAVAVPAVETRAANGPGKVKPGKRK